MHLDFFDECSDMTIGHWEYLLCPETVFQILSDAVLSCADGVWGGE